MSLYLDVSDGGFFNAVFLEKIFLNLFFSMVLLQEMVPHERSRVF